MTDAERQRLIELREELWRNGLIRIAGLVRIDRVLGLDTYARLEVSHGSE